MCGTSGTPLACLLLDRALLATVLFLKVRATSQRDRSRSEEIKKCGAERRTVTSTGNTRKVGYAGENSSSQICNLTDITAEHELRLSSGISELDRVLGAGFVEGSVVLIGGDPGIGKSTLLIQTMAILSQQVIRFISVVKSPLTRSVCVQPAWISR